MSRALVLRGDAAHLPLADESVDLIVTSPPYFGLRSYTDGGEHYDGQVGSEATPREFLEALWACTREWMRVLKPEGSLFVNLGDKYAGGGMGGHGDGRLTGRVGQGVLEGGYARRKDAGVRDKSLLGLPWRYALGCIDDLGLILRAEVVWAKPNGLPESVTDRVRRSHEQVLHFTRQSRYFAAVDEVREAHAPATAARYAAGYKVPKRAPGELGLSDRGIFNGEPQSPNPLGKLPGSVWEIPSQPLTVPAHLGVDHFAAFPMELPRRCILGWSPSGICTECGEGRRPVTRAERVPLRPGDRPGAAGLNGDQAHGFDRRAGTHVSSRNVITGYACACTPYTDHPERRDKDFHASTDRAVQGMNDRNGGERYRRYMDEMANPRGPVREYHLDDWAPPPARPAMVVDPFGGTGTTALVASVLGRTGVTVDRSADYCRIAQWRTSDPAERARAMQVPKPPPVADGQGTLFGDLYGEAV